MPKLTGIRVEVGVDRLAMLRYLRQSDHYCMNMVDNKAYFPG